MRSGGRWNGAVAPPLSLRFLQGQGGDFDFELFYLPDENLPTLSHKTRQGWGNPDLRINERISQPPVRSTDYRRARGPSTVLPSA